MALADVIADVEARRKTLTLFNPDDEAFVEDVEAYFETQNVEIEGETTTSGRPSGFAVLALDGEYLAAVDTGTLRDLMEGVPTGPEGVGIDDSEYHDLLQYLKETTFTSYDKGQMIQASREIEDRAYRVGSGNLYAGFQYASIFRDQETTYEGLAETGVDVVTFASPDVDPPEPRGVTVVADESEEIENTWFVVFDGGGDDRNKSAILAEEREPNSFYGFWTYDPGIVDRIVEYLSTGYDRVSP